MAAGASIAFQTVRSKAGTPASAKVGTSGIWARRPGARGRNRGDAAARVHRNHGDGLVDHGVDRAGDEIVDRGSRATVGDVVGLSARHMQEGDGGKMGGRARARMAEIEGTRLSP